MAFCFVTGCTKQNPAAVCHDGTCIDPSHPYCDFDGSVGGQPGTCIAVTCTPGALDECTDGNTALVCTAGGNNYSSVQCANGCDPTIGCLECAPNQTVCSNGTVYTCDASGNATMQSCPLGCFEDQPRCRDIDPSNGLATYLDMVPDPPDFIVTAGESGRVNSDDGANGGGGGGGVGRIRINTPTSYTATNTTVIAGEATAGTLASR